MAQQIDLPDYDELFQKKLAKITESYRYNPQIKVGLTPYLAAFPHDAQTAYEGLISYIQFDIEKIIGEPTQEIDTMLRYLSTLVRRYEIKIKLSGNETITREYFALTQRWREITQNTTPTQAHIREMEKKLFAFYQTYLVAHFMN